MPLRRLVLIEGMIGAGKSTLAGRLAANLAKAGAKVRVFDEFADDHPIRTKAVDFLRSRTIGPDSAYDLTQWNAVANFCVRGKHTVILESALLQNSVMPHLVDDAPIAVVKEVFADIVERIAPAAPLLVYLRPADIAAAIRRVHAERGEPWSSRNYAFVSACPWARRQGLVGEEAVVELYRTWECVVDELLPKVESVLVEDPQWNWDRTLQRLERAVGMKPGANFLAKPTRAW